MRLQKAPTGEAHPSSPFTTVSYFGPSETVSKSGRDSNSASLAHGATRLERETKNHVVALPGAGDGACDGACDGCGGESKEVASAFVVLLLPA